MDLKGKVALVTGGAAGHGKAFCEELLKQGCKVAICDINSDSGEELHNHLSSKHGEDKVLFCPCDVTDYPQFEEAFQTTISQLGGIDIVINNAAVMNDRLWELEVDVNLNGVIRGLLLAFRFMGKDRGGRGGVVVNTGSSSSAHPMVSLPVYTATKHAVSALTRSYGDQFHVQLTGVKVISICPAPSDRALQGDPRKRLLSSEYEKAWQRDKSSYSLQKSEHVAKALVELIQKAPTGTSWLVENSKQPSELHLFP